MPLDAIRDLLSPGPLARSIYLTSPRFARELRLASGTSQHGLARTTSVPQCLISQYETGIKLPSESTAAKLISYLVDRADPIQLSSDEYRSALYELRPYFPTSLPNSQREKAA